MSIVKVTYNGWPFWCYWWWWRNRIEHRIKYLFSRRYRIEHEIWAKAVREIARRQDDAFIAAALSDKNWKKN